MVVYKKYIKFGIQQSNKNDDILQLFKFWGDIKIHLQGPGQVGL